MERIVVIVEDGDIDSNFKTIRSLIINGFRYKVLPKKNDQERFRTVIPTLFTDPDAVTTDDIEFVEHIVNQCNAFFVLDYQLTPSNNKKDMALSNAQMFYRRFINGHSDLENLPVLFYSSQHYINEHKLSDLRSELHKRNVKTEFVPINYEEEDDIISAIRNTINNLLATNVYKLSVSGAIKGSGTYAPGSEVEIIFDYDGEKEFIKWKIISGNGCFNGNSENNKTAIFITGNENTEIKAIYNYDKPKPETPPKRQSNER